ncbi:RagB/SusD family nutrient uptake outer membrane protein [Hymenobacter sp. BRD128]|uniref:RagB/SusD family nutrient uptake outer membrane protein n=1 Tax=Hymenobacter sp. BRD128 TaxID=2675878 RepID=UPI001563992E|nr:RagB/SusD family nutrient uptake outer membrane protein [Hymenobacter sp. BRD128]QKG57479.1 RagB/SusD family nutrient uptake outer membrane protein [Hymenobacter sp. BRD128]
MKSVLKNRFSTAVCTVALALGAFSCQKALLEPVPVTYLLPAQAFDTPSRVLAQVNGLYSYVKTGGFLGGRYQIYGDIRANDFINRTSNSVTGLSVWNHTESETSQNDVINTWGYGYAAINQVNIFLASLDANADKLNAAPFPTGYAATATNYRAEARLLRALCYYSLLQLYARPYIEGAGSKPGLPLRLTAEMQLSSNNDLARSTVAQVYDQIILDLNFAEQNLPLTYTASQNGVSTSTLNVTRAHRNTAIALKTRVYLSMGRYDDVIREANKIVSATAPFTASTGVNHALASTVAAVFAAPQETSESILSFPFTAQDTPGTQNQLAYYYLPASLGGNGEYGLNTAATGILNNAGWLSTDNRRTNFVAKVGTEYFLTKYPTGTPYTDKAPVIRYAEVLLNLAEARVRSTNTIDAQALALLNAVRGRSNPAIAATATTPAIPVATYLATDFASVTAFLNAILLERRIEFLGEGIRNMDLMRLDATIPGKGSVGAVDPTNVLYVWPIPSTELAANLLMTRN